MLSDPVVLILLYFILPVWLAAGFADWLCHRAAHIETTSGAKESMLHLLMFAENRAVLNMNNYGRCEYKRDLTKALTLLNEAAAKGDDTAKGILEQFHLSNQQ